MLALHGAARRKFLNLEGLPVGVPFASLGELRLFGRELLDDLFRSGLFGLGSVSGKTTEQQSWGDNPK